MDEPAFDPATSGQRIEVGGLGGSLSADALRALLDPATREDAVIDVDLSKLTVSIPAASLRDVLARLLPDGQAELADAGLTVRPGGGSPGVRITVPAAGVRLRIGTDGLRAGPG